MPNRTSPWVRAGLWAAVLSGTPSTLIALSRGEDILASTEAVGAVLVRNPHRGWARVAVGGVAHVLISLFWARVLHRALRKNIEPAGAIAAGAACGAGIALLDLGLIARFLPPIRALPASPLLADHIAFGAIVGWVLQRSR